MRTQRLLTSESLMLDIIRVLASVVVAFGHHTLPWCSTGWGDRTPQARCAVAVFFVLSGFIIRYVTTLRASTLRTYMGDRLSRIYSVAIPALLFTLIADTVGRHFNPAFYVQFDSTYSPRPILHVLANLAFAGQLWQHTIEPLSNSPYWSVNYEMAYYLGYGFFFYLSGIGRWLAILLLCLVVGPHILYLAPLWIAGCFIHDLYQRWNLAGTTAHNLFRSFAASLLFAASVLWVRIAHHALLHRSALSSTAIHQNRLTPIDYAFGIVWLPIFMGILFIARRWDRTLGPAFVKQIRFVSEGTFPIYLFHYPMFILAAALIPYNHQHAWPKLLLLAVAMMFGILAGDPCNRFKDRLRILFARRRSNHAFPSTPIVQQKEVS
ncbi:MAG TPA: acyltransferase [Acidobacteriaceae bacterium]|nr:acyltransferase [Acidobacteriaceae bacterium]